MPTYLDIHDIPGVKAADVAGAHAADLKVQDTYGVNYKHYWVDEAEGKVFCLVDAPDKETAARVHRSGRVTLGSATPSSQASGVEQGAWTSMSRSIRRRATASPRTSTTTFSWRGLLRPPE